MSLCLMEVSCGTDSYPYRCLNPKQMPTHCLATTRLRTSSPPLWWDLQPLPSSRASTFHLQRVPRSSVIFARVAYPLPRSCEMRRAQCQCCTAILLGVNDPRSLSRPSVFFTNLEIATADLLCEGRYAEEMQAKPKTGSTMVSYVWGLIQFGGLVSACFVGPLADAYNPRVIFWGCVPLALAIVIPTALGYLGDPKVRARSKGV